MASYAWSGDYLNCTTCGSTNPFITSIYYIVSAVPSVLTGSGHSWDFYHVAGRTHLSSNVLIDSCDYHGATLHNLWQGVSLGHVMGKTVAGTFTGNYRMFYEDFISGNTYCSFHDKGYNIASNAAIYYNIYTTGSGSTVHYIGRAWISGTWVQMFDETLTKGANNIDASWEMEALFDDLEVPRVPLNYIQKIRANFGGTIYPLHNAVLPSYASSSLSLLDFYPFVQMDRVTADYTAVGIAAN